MFLESKKLHLNTNKPNAIPELPPSLSLLLGSKTSTKPLIQKPSHFLIKAERTE